MRRVFLAIGLPEPVRRALTVAQFLLPLPRRSDPADLHLTLVFMGEQSDTGLQALDDEITRLRAAVAEAEARGYRRAVEDARKAVLALDTGKSAGRDLSYNLAVRRGADAISALGERE